MSAVLAKPNPVIRQGRRMSGPTVHRGAGTMLELDQLGPGERTVVSVPPGMRVYSRLHTKAGTDIKTEEYCRRTGKVRVNRLPATT